MTTTLLSYVQDISSALGTDEVNSISDSTEAMQIAVIVKTAYNSLVSRLDLPDHFQLFELDPSLDITKPVLMYRPSNVESILFIKYNSVTLTETNINFKEILFQPLDVFLDRMYLLSEDADNVSTFTHTVNGSSLTFLYNTDANPYLYTTPDDNTLIFNSYLSDVDTTLQSTKSLAYGKIAHGFTMSDTFVPFPDIETSSLLLNEAKSLAFAELKQMPHAKAEQTVRRLLVHGQKSKRAVNTNRSELDRLPDYGRKPIFNVRTIW